ncbi:integrin beta pat-3-like [Bradysia coprophila]|uniref:integrin beta pat-3-like n=1 Tax=Bradysia coprophila TaxID=38358 RepID=UPI00187D8A07|nr:integrin beta pat-3-like [Bradysia coprophila]
MNFYAVLLVFISVYVADSRTYAAITCGPDDIYLTNPADCGSYYQCSNGVPYLQHCAPTHSGSLVFDPSLNVCVQPSEYDCAKSVTITKSPETTTEPPETTTEPPEAPTDPPEVATQPPEITVEPTEGEAFGPCHGNSYFVNPDDCGSFFQCEDGVTNLIHCPLTHSGSLVFDPSLNVCVWPSEYDCTKSVTTTQPPETITEPPVTTTEPPETTTETPEPVEATTEAFGTCHGHTYLVNPDDCRSFYQCTNGVAELIHCPSTHDGSLVFDPSLNVCVWPSEYDCTKSVTTIEPPETTTEPPETTPDTFNPCHEFSHPTTCLSSPNNCSFCFDTCFRDGAVDMIRCDKYENLLKAGCHTFKLNRTEYDSVVKTSPNCSTWLPLEPGKKRKFSVTFSLEKHPLDLYYLMDFSGSMSDDKSNLITLSSGLLETLANLTDDFHIGFGTFVDKPISPFGARGDYSFHNDFPLTSETDGFVTKISDIPIKGGGDGPESHADALVQVVECSDQIGWRNNTRRVVLLATDIYFHIAGDGRRSNINDPYVDGCYLDSLGAYTEELTMDYPSVEQLANAYSKKQATTTAIFATGSSTVKFYEEVASQFKSAYVGVLKTDSSNVLELIKNEFAKIDSRMEIEKSDTTDSVSFKYFSNCMNSDDERETTICEHLPKTGEVTFVVEIDLAECPSDKDETGMKFDLNPVGLPIFIEVELSYLCD